MRTLFKPFVFFAVSLACAWTVRVEARTLNVLCLAKFLHHQAGKLATLADTDPTVINLTEYKVLEPDENPWQHQVVGSPDYIEDRALGRHFFVQGKMQWKDANLEAPPQRHVQLTEISFVYEHELVGKNGEFLKGWGRLMVVTKTQDFNTGNPTLGKYEWAGPNPAAPLLKSGRERYYKSLKDEGYTDQQIADIQGRDNSLPLIGSRYYVVAVDGNPKALLRIYGAKNDFTTPHEIAAGKPQKPINPEFDRNQSEPMNLEVGNAFTDSQDGSGIRYADFWEYGWLNFIKSQMGDTKRPMNIHATASGVGARLYARNYKFPIVEKHATPGYMHLQIDPQKFVDENSARIMAPIDQFREKNGITTPYLGPIRVNFQ